MTAIILILALVISVAINTMLIFRKKPKPEPESVRTTILEGIRSVSELATVRRDFQSIVTFSSSKKIPGLAWTIPGTTRKFMLRYNGTIVCGCDLTQVKVSEGYGDRVRITLPKSEILDMYADLQSLEVYDQSAGIFTSVKLEDQNREITADLERVREHELKNGLLELSDGNVRKILSSVVAPTGMLADVVFTDGTHSIAGSTALPLEAGEQKNSPQ
ncbi:MAG: DUF4230 domain-containing protein [Synergistaceae bacterium]|nr:DUF4230 domain-containing protein [Synergistaceae bacterium]